MKGPLQIQHIKLIHWTIGLIVSLSQVICQEECPENYFGPNCRFRCNYCQPRCSPEECGKNICARGFFGYLCQYRDLATHWGAPITIYNDGDETTCQTNDSVTTATIPFQATRITFFIFTIDSSSEANLIDDITFELLEGNDKRVCDEGNYSYYLTPFSKYFRCITIVNVTSMLLKGRGVTRLCTVSVSGGRNLAINQQYNYSSLYKNSDGDKGGVDGKIPLSGYINTKTCFQAAENSVNSSFFVIFNIRVLIDYFIVYNRPDVPNRNKIVGFRLITYQFGNSIGFNFKENGRPPEGSGNYTIFNPWPSNAVYMFELLKFDATNNVLQFCEVEAWGECLQGEYGLDCTSKCNSKCRELYCEVTGKCIGCLAGFWGVECTKVCSSGCANKACNQEEGNCTHGCQTGLFSPNCTKECHNCMNNGKCSIDEGHCQDGCLKGFEPPSCENVCPAGTFGVDCKESCPPNCLDNCSPDEGKCNSTCSNGYFGENCEKVCNDGCFNNMCHRDNGSCMACDTGFFSEDCSGTCSDKCLNKTCHRNSGTCVACPEGFFSEDCSRSCKKGCLKGECNHENGACFACDPMYYSSDCSQACSESCAGKRCDQDKGTCLGCNPGYYLSDCSQKCNNGCLNGLCYQENGSCVACESQFYSSNCSKGEKEPTLF
ncbi:uncharacterized protein LOC106061387 [Biomphalaria glabrata]|uniref:Uncharacterized protein LOC106061387 n=1 Tax=Biomphalaria glabrata TaxID=6526 RepID=A0A9W2Z5M1_BIOGL|nr:uncharacterized protein LOC106061387 [Biomphalaria glabrata]